MVAQKKEVKQTNWFLVIGGGLLGVFLVAFLGLVIYISTAFSIYQNTKEGIEVPYPKGWKVVEYPQKDAIVVFVSSKKNAADFIQENISISTVDQSKNPLNIDQFAKLTVEQTMAVFKDAKMMGSSPVHLSGRKGYRTIFAYSGEGKNLTMALYQFMFRETIGYNIMYFGETEVYEKEHRWMYDIMMQLMKLKF